MGATYGNAVEDTSAEPQQRRRRLYVPREADSRVPTRGRGESDAMAAVTPTSVPPPAVAEARRPAAIVPLAGLPLAGIVLAFLVVSIAGNWLWALDFYHVVGGGMWTVLDLFVGFIVGQLIIARLSLPARAEFLARFMPAMALIMPTLVTMTLAAGFQLARHVGYLNSSYPQHAWVVASFFLVGVMAVIALGSRFRRTRPFKRNASVTRILGENPLEILPRHSLLPLG